ncbi:MAG: hypothetical protein K1060chlam4_00261 [Candidatus Anoxychlamydiales bacterium]|nr:hypothetical protein [Candidatus Anoxychlamydiales bacterium]
MTEKETIPIGTQRQKLGFGIQHQSNQFSSEQSLHNTYMIRLLLDKLYPGENLQKEILLFYFASALVDKFTTIFVLSDYITKARMFVEAILSVMPSPLIKRFSGHTIKELAKLGLKSKKILFLTNFIRNREFIEELTLSDNTGANFGEGLKIQKLTIVTVARKHDFFNKYNIPKNAIIIELSDTIEQSKELIRFGLTTPKHETDTAREDLRDLLLSLNSKVQITVPVINTLMNHVFSYVVPDAFIDHNKFIQLIEIIALLNQEKRKQHQISDEITEIIACPADVKYALEIGTIIFYNEGKNLPLRLLNFLNFIFSWSAYDKTNPLPGGFYFRKKMIENYRAELNAKIDLITQYKGLRIKKESLENLSKEVEIKQKKAKKVRRKAKYSTFLRLIELNIKTESDLDETKYTVHDRKTYESYFKELSAYNYLEENKLGINCIFRFLRAPALKRIQYSDIHENFEQEYNNYIKNIKN